MGSLFVCVHDSCRSQMAEAFFEGEARGRGYAESAGTQPAARVNPIMLKAMREAGIDLTGKAPRMLTEKMVRRADRVVTTGCSIEEACPVTGVESEDWGLEDPAGKPIENVRRIRDDMRARVVDMLWEA